jgi:phosphoglycolate phosphatase-like HAD superfamily hydrolase
MAASMNKADSTEVIIFDFDGTIVDSMPFLIEVATRLLTSRYGMELEAARRAYVDTCGLPFVRQMEIIFPGDQRNPGTVRDFESQKRMKLLEFNLFPDVMATIRRLRAHGIKVCLSSGNLKELIEEFLRSRNLEVDLVMGFRPGFEKGLDHFEFARRTFDSALERIIFVGDSRKDGLTAQEAGLRFIARAGLLPAGTIEEVLPGVPVVNSLHEVLPILGIEIAQEDSWVDATS